MHQVIQPRVMYFGTPVVLISTTNQDGSTNLAPFSSAWWLDQSCMLGLAQRSQTTLNMVRTRECVLNLPSAAMVDAVDQIALYTGTEAVPAHKARKGYQYASNKFKLAGLTEVESDLVQPSRASECPIQLEAVVQNISPFGSVDSGTSAIEVKIVRTHVNGEIMMSGSDRYIDPQLWDPLIMKFCEFYGRGQNLRHSLLADAWEMQTNLPARPPTNP